MMRTEGYGRDGTYTSTRFCCRRARRGCHFSKTYVERSNNGAEIFRNEDREEGRTTLDSHRRLGRRLTRLPKR